MQYDFSTQQKMLEATISLLEDFNIKDVSALGGGTALAIYWNHRFSADIDVFIFGEDSHVHKMKPKNWGLDTTELFKNIGFKDDFKINPFYTEFAITEEEKIQLFDAKSFTGDNHFKQENIWGMNFNIESIEEIIAKKIFYRCEDFNARDIFDISIAINKNPLILKTLFEANTKFKEKFGLFESKLESLLSSEERIIAYKKDITEMTPNYHYQFLQDFSPNYLHQIFQETNTAISYSMFDDEVCTEIENIAFKEFFENNNHLEELIKNHEASLESNPTLEESKDDIEENSLNKSNIRRDR